MNKPRTLAAGGWLLAIIGMVFSAWSLENKAFLPAFTVIATIAMIWAWRLDIPIRWLLVFAILGRIALLPTPPTLSNDVFRYLWDGQLIAAGENPFQHQPNDNALAHIPRHAWFENIDTTGYFSIYPPVSQVFFAIAGWASQFGFDAGYYVLKILFAFCELGALIILSRFISRKMLLLYAWNPILLLETWGQAHTETILLICLAGCFWAIRKARYNTASALLTLAVWTKLWPVLFFPFLLRRIGRSPAPFIIAAGLTLALWLPFWHPNLISNFRASLHLYVASFEWNAGLYYFLKSITTEICQLFGAHPDFETSKYVAPAMRWVMLLFIVALYWFRRHWPLERSFAVITALFTLSLATIQPWYFVPVFFAIAWFEDVEWNWLWVAVCTIGTYLASTNSSPIYLPFVILGWSGFFGFLAMQGLLRNRPSFSLLKLPQMPPRDDQTIDRAP